MASGPRSVWWSRIQAYANRVAEALAFVAPRAERADRVAATSSARAALCHALGDRQVRTDRLPEAEESYGAALPIYRQIEDRLGEANTLQALGNLALAQGKPRIALELIRDALRRHQGIDDRLGEAASYGYLARCALAAEQPVRAAVLAFLRLLVAVDDRFGRALAIRGLLKASVAANNEPLAVLALLLCWHASHQVDEPNAGPLGQILSQMIPDFDPARPPLELLAEAGQQLICPTRPSSMTRTKPSAT